MNFTICFIFISIVFYPVEKSNAQCDDARRILRIENLSFPTFIVKIRLLEGNHFIDDMEVYGGQTREKKFYIKSSSLAFSIEKREVGSNTYYQSIKSISLEVNLDTCIKIRGNYSVPNVRSVGCVKIETWLDVNKRLSTVYRAFYLVITRRCSYIPMIQFCRSTSKLVLLRTVYFSITEKKFSNHLFNYWNILFGWKWTTFPIFYKFVQFEFVPLWRSEMSVNVKPLHAYLRCVFLWGCVTASS